MIRLDVTERGQPPVVYVNPHHVAVIRPSGIEGHCVLHVVGRLLVLDVAHSAAEVAALVGDALGGTQ
jgi:ribosomal protein L32E